MIWLASIHDHLFLVRGATNLLVYMFSWSSYAINSGSKSIATNTFGVSFPSCWYQVFDLSTVKPHEFVQYGLTCLDNFANSGDSCAKETREKLRVVVCFFADFIVLLNTIPFHNYYCCMRQFIWNPVCIMYVYWQVAGGDGTVGWVLGCLGEINKRGLPVPSTGVIPLGTGNDLSRSFGWVSFYMHRLSN